VSGRLVGRFLEEEANKEKGGNFEGGRREHEKLFRRLFATWTTHCIQHRDAVVVVCCRAGAPSFLPGHGRTVDGAGAGENQSNCLICSLRHQKKKLNLS